MRKITNEQLMDFLNNSLTNNNLQKTLNEIAKLIGNPIAVFDANYYVLGYSDITNIDDNVWLRGRIRGYCLYEYAVHLQKLQDDDGIKSRLLIGFGKYRRRLCKVMSDSVVIGYFSVLEQNISFDEVDDSIYDLVAGVVSKEISIERALKPGSKGAEAEVILIDLINVGFANPSLLAHRILGTPLDSKTNYRLIAINMAKFTSTNMGEANFKALISRIFPRCWSVFIKGYVITLVDWKMLGDNFRDYVDTLSTLLSAEGLTAGISDEFSGLYDIRTYYNQAINVHSFASKNEIIAFYNAHKLFHMVNYLHTSTDHLFTDELIEKISNYDRVYNTEYVKTIYYYIKCDKSPTRAATCMNAHKNTIVYRIDKVKELFNFDFNDEHRNIQLYISCLILDIKK